jgi:hypothetical protein
MCKNQCLLRYGRCSCDLYSRGSVWFPCIWPHLSALRQTEAHTLSQIPGFTRNCWQPFSALYHNTSVNLSSAPNTPKPSGVSATKSAEDWGQEIVQASWLAFRFLSTVHRNGSAGVWQCRDNEVSHHAWTTLCSRWRRWTCSKGTGE